ncbi:MAG TPA: SpoIIE family protein phosphatase [Acidimicrobiales bacterium]|nr:SpoIIE family protein phosphatase [Acidimicrobiales bacterium]
MERETVSREPDAAGVGRDHDRQVERFLSVQRAARAMTSSAAEWWRELTKEADTAITAEALDSFYHRALVSMQRVLGADEVSVLLSDTEGTALVTRASIGLGEERPVQLHIPAGGGMAGRVFASSEPLIVPDLSAIELVSPVLREQGLRSVVAVPILNTDRESLGVLHAGSRQLGHFTASDAELLSFLAERVGVVIERVRLFEEQRHMAQVSAFLADTARIMAGASDLAATLDELAKAALPVIGDICLIDMLAEDGSLKRVVARHTDPSRQTQTDRLMDEFPPVITSRHPAAEVLRQGGTQWSATMPEEFMRATTHNEEHLALTKALGFRSYIAVPIATGAEALGTLTLVSCTRALTPDDVALSEGLALHVSSVIAKARQLDRESHTSRVLQEALLPVDLPTIPGLVIHTSYAAASHALNVGGDFYDAMHLPDGRAWLMIGDVEGHDRRAAAEMGQLRSAARTLAAGGQDPARVVDDLRRGWSEIGLTRTATVTVGTLDPEDGRLVLVSAGHPPPLLIARGTAAYLDVPTNMLLGMSGGPPAISHEVDLARGDMLLLYTDGALQERAFGIELGMELLRKSVQDAERVPQIVCSTITDGLPDRPDDIALLAVMRQ